MGQMPPMLHEAPMPWPLGRLVIPCLLVLLALALAFGMVQRCRFRNNPLLKGCILGINHLVLATLLRKVCVVLVGMLVLVLGLQRRIYICRAMKIGGARRIGPQDILHHGEGYAIGDTTVLKECAPGFASYDACIPPELVAAEQNQA